MLLMELIYFEIGAASNSFGNFRKLKWAMFAKEWK